MSAIDIIARFEGFSAEPFWDHQQWSVGYGSYAGSRDRSRPPTGHNGFTYPLTRSAGRSMLQQELPKYAQNVDSYNSKYNWTPNERDALISFAYNIGSINQLTANGTRSKAEIAQAMLLYNKASGRVLPGLTARRNQEYQMFTGGQIPPQDTSQEGLAPEDQFGNAESQTTDTGTGSYGGSSTNGATSLSDIVSNKENADEWWPNELDTHFESYTYNLEWFAVDQNSAIRFINEEDFLLDDIMNDAWPPENTKRISIAMTGASTEFNIHDLTIESLGSSSGNISRMGGTATKLSFSVTQVGNTSLGDSLQSAALLNGFTSISECTWFIKVKFVGYVTNGSVAEPIPATKVFPFKIRNIGDLQTTTDARGTTSAIEGTIFQDVAFTQHINSTQYQFEFDIKETLKDTLDDYLKKLNESVEVHNFTGEAKFVNSYKITVDPDFEQAFFQSPMNGPDANLSSGNGTVARTAAINIAQQVGVVTPGMSIYSIIEDICIQSILVREELITETDSFSKVLRVTPKAVPKPEGFNIMEGHSGFDVTYHLSIEKKYIVQNAIDQSIKSKNVSKLIQEIFDTGRCNKIYYHLYTGLNDQIIDLTLSFNRQLVKSYVTPSDESLWNNFVQSNSDKLFTINEKAQNRINELREQQGTLDRNIADSTANMQQIRDNLEAQSNELASDITEQLKRNGVDIDDSAFEGATALDMLNALSGLDDDTGVVNEILTPEVRQNINNLAEQINSLEAGTAEAGNLSAELEQEIRDIYIEAMGANLSNSATQATNSIVSNFQNMNNSSNRSFVLIEELGEDVIEKLTTEQFDSLLESILDNPIVFKRVVIPMMLDTSHTHVFRSTDTENVELARRKYYESLDNDVSMKRLTMTIKGDPYWLENYVTPAKAKVLFGDNNADERYRHHVMSHNGNNYVIIVTNKAAGVDENDNMKIAKLSVMCYMVKSVVNNFSSGVFTQTLDMVKMMIPESFFPMGGADVYDISDDGEFSTTEPTDSQTETSPSNQTTRQLNEEEKGRLRELQRAKRALDAILENPDASEEDKAAAQQRYDEAYANSRDLF